VTEYVDEDRRHQHYPPPTAFGVVVLLEGQQLAEIGDETGRTARGSVVDARALRVEG
jgi:hypothetical protein